MGTNYIILVIILIIWCVVHSIMIDYNFMKYLERKFPTKIHYYRLFYNIFSTIFLLPVMIYAYSLPKQIYFNWEGYYVIIQFLLIAFSMVFFITGYKNYDLSQLAGTQQIKNKTAHKSLSKSGELKTEGILSITRHPWYTAFFIILWAREINTTSLIINIIFSIYIVAGTYLEEQKLIVEFEESYVKYQKKVSMLLPFKWIKLKFKKTKVSLDL